MPLISVLMVAYNAQEYIANAIKSVLNQSFIDFELIIIDDGSTDDTISTVNTFKDHRIVLISREHDYIANLNYGISVAKGKYIARLDSDDYFHSDKLLTQFKRMELHPDIDVCSTFGCLIEKGHRSQPIYDNQQSNHIQYALHQLLRSNFILHSSVMIRRQFLLDHNCEYTNQYSYCEDYSLWVQIAQKGGHFYIEPQILTGILKHEAQITSKKHLEMKQNSIKLRSEIIKYLIEQTPNCDLQCSEVDNLINYISLNNLDYESLFGFYYSILSPVDLHKIHS